MAIDYKALSEENKVRYGTDVGEWAPELLANLYSERTHFVFELLQNAEDAIGKSESGGSRSVRFELRREGLRVAHFGKPFDEADVRGICGINRSTKKSELTAIGRFGIGFKSVYAVTDRPEIRSAGQHFAIESYVHPVGLDEAPDTKGETSFWFPFRLDDLGVFDEIAEGLRKLNAQTLLFLRHVEEVDWSIEGGDHGTYVRDTEEAEEGLRKVTLIGTSVSDGALSEEQWHVFSKRVCSGGTQVGHAEIAYLLDSQAEGNSTRLKTIPDSRLAAFFPTSVRTNLGVVLQAPFRTTPARDNVPHRDPWNQHLISELASLLVESLERLKERRLLSVDVLCGMPLDGTKFGEGTMFQPLFNAFSEALRTRELLPAYSGSFISSSRAILARGQELCELLDSSQLSSLFESGETLEWLTDGITIDRTGELRTYLMGLHGIREVQPQTFVPKVTKAFLEAQADEWVTRLYEFLNGQSYVLKTASNLNKPWVRLEDRTHVVAYTGDQPNAFLPSKSASGFETVRTAVCQSDEAMEFLRSSLKLTEPDPVDDVIKNILPLYPKEFEEYDLDAYRNHLKAIEAGYENRNTREKLVSALKTAHWVPSIDNEGNKGWLTPYQCYLSTERLRQLFEGVPGINFVDDSVQGLQGEAIRSILIACGSERYLDTVPPKVALTPEERYALRERYGDTGCSGGETTDDRTLHGLDGILKRISELPIEQAAERCQVMWDALADVVQDKRQGVVSATYSWSYYSTRSITTDAAFIRTLKHTAWVPGSRGNLVTPDEAVFESIESAWSPNAVLQAALKFRPSALAQLAEATGLSLDILSQIKKSGLSDEEVLERLGLVPANDDGVKEEGEDSSQAGGIEKDDNGREGESGHSDGSDGNQGESSAPGSGGGGGHPSSGNTSSGDSGSSGGGGGSSQLTNKNSHAGRREFFSYLKTHPVEVEEDEFSDSETHEECMRVESVAINHILNLEPDLHRTPAGNKGFDLFATDEDGLTNRWIEVKAMVGTLVRHPVGMSKAQFESAQEKKTRFWLYIVENATSEEPRILRIQDPAGNARTFTFDAGWSEIATVSQVNLETGEVKV